MLDLSDLKKSDFYYELPEELIAQTPIEPRNHSRLMVIDRKTGEISHDRFYNLCRYLKKGDTLVVNDSRRTAGENIRRERVKRQLYRVFAA